MTLATEAGTAADRAGVDVLELDTADATARGAALLQEVWGGAETVLPANVIRAIQRCGGYCFGAYDVTGALLAVSVGLLGEGHSLHSHITGVLPAGQRRGLGYALKQHQRTWCLEHGLDVVTWTCDPLVVRNVAFNLHALGADVVAYLPNHYGLMADAVNAGDESDRVELRWDLRSERAVAAAHARLPYLDEGAGRLVPLPADIETLRRRDPAAARAWRLAVREALVPALAEGLVVGGLTSSGALVLEEKS